MNAKRVSAAAGVVLAAQKQRQTPAGIAAALEAAGLLQSPESAAERVALREAQEAPVVVRRFDIAMEPAPEEEQVLTIGCVAEDGRPVALLLDLDDRPKVARWLALDEGTSMHDSVTGANLARWEEEQENARLRARVAELEAQRDRRRVRLVALQNDALNMRGSLAPNGEARKVPFELGETLTPAVDWLINRVAELEVLKPAPIQTCQFCGAGYAYGGPCSVCAYKRQVAEALGRDLPEDPCHPCGCPKRFNRHADGCAYSECPSCAAPADVTGQRIPEHRTGCPQAVAL